MTALVAAAESRSEPRRSATPTTNATRLSQTTHRRNDANHKQRNARSPVSTWSLPRTTSEATVAAHHTYARVKP